MADLGLEKGTEVSRPASQLGALLGLWPEEDMDQNAGRLKTAQGSQCSQVRMEETDSVPWCLHRPDPVQQENKDSLSCQGHTRQQRPLLWRGRGL